MSGLIPPPVQRFALLNTEISVGPVLESVCQDEGVPVVDPNTAWSPLMIQAQCIMYLITGVDAVPKYTSLWDTNEKTGWQSS